MNINKEQEVIYSTGGTRRTKVELITGYAAVLHWLSINPQDTQQEIADGLGLAQRHVSNIIARLEQTGFITIEDVEGISRRGPGGATKKAVNYQKEFYIPGFGNRKVGDLIKFLDDNREDQDNS